MWSLIGGLQAAGGILPHDDYIALLNPGYDREGTSIMVDRNLAGDSTGVAAALGLVTKEEGTYRLTVNDVGPVQFADLVHDRLLAAEDGSPDAVILEAYAWLVAESHRRKDLGWSAAPDRDDFVDDMLVGLTGQDDDGTRPMNTTKLPAWRRWLVFLGLAIDLPMTLRRSAWHFCPARRIALELERAGLPRGATLAGAEFARIVGERCPYLDGGRKYRQACRRLGYVHPSRDLSAAMTIGLRELEADGVLEFSLLGDSGDALHFVPDPSFRNNSFNRVILREATP